MFVQFTVLQPLQNTIFNLGFRKVAIFTDVLHVSIVEMHANTTMDETLTAGS